MNQLSIDPHIKGALNKLPPGLLDRSGSIFYSGPSALNGRRELYILGLNPGGCPQKQWDETIGLDLQQFYARTEPWSAYEHESWRGRPPGTYGIQSRILHLFKGLGRRAVDIPASNVIFVRTSSELKLAPEKDALLEQCWPVHQAAIDRLSVKVVLCLGKTAGKWVRKQLDAVELVDSYIETNARKWLSTCHITTNAIRVVTVAHPGRADWTNPAADPTPLVRRALG